MDYPVRMNDMTVGRNDRLLCLTMCSARGVQNAKDLGEVQRTFMILKWTKTIGAMGLDFNHVDPTNGHLAAKLHDTSVRFSKGQAALETLGKDLEKSIGIITGLGDKKRSEIQHIKDPTIFKQQLQKIDNWTTQKMNEKRDFFSKERNRVHELQVAFASSLMELLDAVEAQHYNRLPTEPEVDITSDLEAQLQALLLESHGPDSAAGGSPPRKVLLAVKDEAVETTATADPGPDGPDAMVEAKEQKRLLHNARVTFDRRIKGGDCPPEIMEREFAQWQSNGTDRLKQLGQLFNEWYKSGQDFMGTTIMQEANQRISDESRGKQIMMSFKAMKEKYGKKTAEKIRDRKKEEEKHRNPNLEPRAFWFAHPEAIDDPATR
ncbi:unnamed protein product [Symbiodinium sp. CCMP2592]|nr:unnamed protein product [Symbiodinium sp. CCMP2592]